LASTSISYKKLISLFKPKPTTYVTVTILTFARIPILRPSIQDWHIQVIRSSGSCFVTFTSSFVGATYGIRPGNSIFLTIYHVPLLSSAITNTFIPLCSIIFFISFSFMPHCQEDKRQLVNPRLPATMKNLQLLYYRIYNLFCKLDSCT